MIARTDAVAVEGFSAAIERAQLFMRMPGPMRSSSRLPARPRSLRARSWPRSASRLPLMANMVEGGKHADPAPRPNWRPWGTRSSSSPEAAVRAMARTAQEFYAHADASRHERRRCATSMLDFGNGLNEVIGTARNADARQEPTKAKANEQRSIPSPSRSSRAASSRSPTRWTPRSIARPSIRSSPRRATPAMASTTPRPATTLVQGAARPADLRRRDGFRSEGRDRQGGRGTGR
jgi:hypothetical protein